MFVQANEIFRGLQANTAPLRASVQADMNAVAQTAPPALHLQHAAQMSPPPGRLP